jgi:transposase
MIHLPASVRVYLCLSPCDMRRSFDGLHALVRDHLRLDAFAGHLYLFANKRRDRLKILWLCARICKAPRFYWVSVVGTVGG